MIMKKIMLIVTTILFFCLTAEAHAETHVWSNWKTLWPSTCTTNGCQIRTCQKCGETETKSLPLLPHFWGSWNELIRENAYHSGSQYRECSECEELEERNVPKRKKTKEEEKILKLMKKYLSASKSYNRSKMQKCIDKKVNYPKGRLYKKYNKKMLSFQILNIEKKKNTYLVTAKVKYPNLEEVTFNAYYDAMDMTHSRRNFKKILNQRIRHELKHVYPASRKVTFQIVLKKGKYKIKKDRITVSLVTGYWAQGVKKGKEAYWDSLR